MKILVQVLEFNATATRRRALVSGTNFRTCAIYSDSAALCSAKLEFSSGGEFPECNPSAPIPSQVCNYVLLQRSDVFTKQNQPHELNCANR